MIRIMLQADMKTHKKLQVVMVWSLISFQTGYMFGKGVYFADMVSKSANYCWANKTNPIGVLLLCEVALGNM